MSKTVILVFSGLFVGLVMGFLFGSLNNITLAQQNPPTQVPPPQGGPPLPFICTHCTTYTEFYTEILQGTTFTNAVLMQSSFNNFDFSGKNFSNAKMGGCDLNRSNFSNVNFTGADLRLCGFDGTNLQNANFTNANIKGAELNFAADVSGATWSNTICPDGTNSDNNGNTCEGHLAP